MEDKTERMTTAEVSAIAAKAYEDIGKDIQEWDELVEKFEQINVPEHEECETDRRIRAFPCETPMLI